MIIFTCDEGPYLLNETRHAIRSLARSDPKRKVLLMLVGAAGAYDTRIRSWHPQIEIRHFDSRDVLLNREAPGFYFSFKAIVLEQVRREFRGPILFLDGDVLVRRSLADIFQLLESVDLAVYFRPELEGLGPMGTLETAKLNTGVVAIADTKAALRYTSLCRQMIEKHLLAGGAPTLERSNPKRVTTIDQEVMWLARLELGDKLRFWPLEDRFNDSCFRDGSAIWHAKGVSRQCKMYRYGIEVIDRPVRAALRHLDLLAKHSRDQFKTYWLRRKMIARHFRLPKSEFARRGFDLKDKRVLALSSDFVAENRWLLAVSKVSVYDWDPLAFYRNRSRLAGQANISHDFCERPKELPFGNYALVLSDVELDLSTFNVPAVLRVGDNSDRFQWHKVQQRARRRRKGPKSTETYALPNLRWCNFGLETTGRSVTCVV